MSVGFYTGRIDSLTWQEQEDLLDAIEARKLDEVAVLVDAIYSSTHPRNSKGNKAWGNFVNFIRRKQKIKLYQHKVYDPAKAEESLKRLAEASRRA